MKIGVFTVLLGDRPFEAALDALADAGAEAVEIGTGNYPGNSHCNPDDLLDQPARQRAFLRSVADRGLVISALSCHGNPLHPRRDLATQHHDTQRKTIRLAQQLGLEVVNTFSGCPGDREGGVTPNWVISAWPTEFADLLEWQWQEVVLPYWTEEAAFARDHGVRLALEMHPGFVVYNAGTLLRLREACGEHIGANFDPSHLFWQGADPLAAARALGEAIFHVHAKDTQIDPVNARIHGMLDAQPYTRVRDRAWIFRTIGYGHPIDWWKNFISTLRVVGYDHVVSIEHEDGLMSIDEGLHKAIALLKEVVIVEPPATPWWS